MPAPGLPYQSNVEFGPYRLNAGERLLTRDGEVIHLPPKTFDLLLVLLSNPGHLVQKAELRRLVWPDAFVDDINLAQHVSLLRRALRDGDNGSRFIETVPRMGYRFVESVRTVQASAPATPADAQGQPTVNPDSPSANPMAGDRRLRFFQRKNAIPLWGALALIVSIATGALIFSTTGHGNGISAQLFRQAERNYFEGRYFWLKRTDDGYRAAIAHFQEAVRLKPDYAEAYAGLADSYILLGSFGVQPLGEVIPKARADALRAIELNEHCAEAHAALGYIFSRFDWNWGDAEREFRRAIEISPEYTTAHHWYALHLITMGRSDAAVAEMRTAQNLDPTSPILNTDTALILFYARHYDDALSEARNVIKADPSFGLAHRTAGIIYSAKGMYHQAIDELSVAATLLGKDPWTLAEIGRCYALLGDQQRALVKFEELNELSRQRFVSPGAMALLAASLTDKQDETFQLLEKEYDARSSSLPLLAVYPGFDSIRNDPRFQKILDRVGLPNKG